MLAQALPPQPDQQHMRAAVLLAATARAGNKEKKSARERRAPKQAQRAPAPSPCAECGCATSATWVATEGSAYDETHPSTLAGEGGAYAEHAHGANAAMLEGGGMGTEDPPT